MKTSRQNPTTADQSSVNFSSSIVRFVLVALGSAGLVGFVLATLLNQFGGKVSPWHYAFALAGGGSVPIAYGLIRQSRKEVEQVAKEQVSLALSEYSSEELYSLVLDSKKSQDEEPTDLGTQSPSSISVVPVPNDEVFLKSDFSAWEDPDTVNH